MYPVDASASKRMKSIRRKGTAPELAVREAFSNLGLRYRLNVRSLPGSPDLASQRLCLAVFVHGCFWHRHHGCNRATTPKRNAAFWAEKFLRNVARDRRNYRTLEQRGYRVLVLWECETESTNFKQQLTRALRRMKCLPQGQ